MHHSGLVVKALDYGINFIPVLKTSTIHEIKWKIKRFYAYIKSVCKIVASETFRVITEKKLTFHVRKLSFLCLL